METKLSIKTSHMLCVSRTRKIGLKENITLTVQVCLDDEHLYAMIPCVMYVILRCLSSSSS